MKTAEEYFLDYYNADLSEDVIKVILIEHDKEIVDKIKKKIEEYGNDKAKYYMKGNISGWFELQTKINALTELLKELELK